MSRVAFIGAGRMATAMVSGLLDTEFCRNTEICCMSAPDGTAEELALKTGIGVVPNLSQLIENADILILAIKPQQLETLEVSKLTSLSGKLVISILAGTKLANLRTKFSEAKNIIRAMPNTPGQIGAGITCYTSSKQMSNEDRISVERILGSMGKVIHLPESQIDAVTALSGSGPAYVFEFVAGLRDAGIEAGLNKEVAYKLAIETTLGSSRLLVRSGETPETLRDLVSSPGGTTLAGLAEMSKADFRGVLRKTVQAAKKRSIELSKPA
ncbi:MAG: Pyrroline-5-carboxylate reductase [Candidatus Moanabacter tarae]|uniref:Pyrroline-5-carboxylate reductase n=1 Tax=Candidatus Moanibacter tarae TaxID=2200854 RepID=A0A2Z4AC16_9BACT|nr:MAG: Pyrroline-5-carboxylate reductase [Candidatus Moanabacter tarae]|tara:strand:- start:1896 stop:2702 length:807 start_codon:yes stop_codon:yes gene_type:complete